MAAGAQTPKNVKYEFTEASDLAGRDEIKHASRAFSLLLAGGALAIDGSPRERPSRLRGLLAVRGRYLRQGMPGNHCTGLQDLGQYHLGIFMRRHWQR